jgi:hypothetical protein
MSEMQQLILRFFNVYHADRPLRSAENNVTIAHSGLLLRIGKP